MLLKIIQALPTIIMAESIAAAAYLFLSGRYGSGLYWLAAGLLNFAVIFLIPGE